MKTETSLENSNLVDEFLAYIKTNKRLLYDSIIQNYNSQPDLFIELGSVMLNWAQKYLGEDYLKVLCNGYHHFTMDVIKAQAFYEKEKRYKNKSYQEVYDFVYNNNSYMNYYHWGVYVATFAWQHHLEIYSFFKNYFIQSIKKSGNALDLGSGSGIWSMLLSLHLTNWEIKGIDISQPSVSLSNQMIKINNLTNVNFKINDALLFKSDILFDACISCLLLEHLECPNALVQNISGNLKPGGFAFITGALTAAEIDHIYEFKKESEIMQLCEENEFRVIATFSSSPKSHSRNSYYLPRTMALVLQKRYNEIW